MWELMTRQVPFEGIIPVVAGMKIAYENARPDIPETVASQPYVNLFKACWYAPRYALTAPVASLLAHGLVAGPRDAKQDQPSSPLMPPSPLIAAFPFMPPSLPRDAKQDQRPSALDIWQHLSEVLEEALSDAQLQDDAEQELHREIQWTPVNEA